MKRSREVISVLSLTAALALGLTACGSAESSQPVRDPNARIQDMARTILARHVQVGDDQRYTGKPPYTAGVLIPLKGDQMAVLNEQSDTQHAGLPLADTVEALSVGVAPRADINHIGQQQNHIEFMRKTDGSWNAYHDSPEEVDPPVNSAADPGAFSTFLTSAERLVNAEPGATVPEFTVPE